MLGGRPRDRHARAPAPGEGGEHFSEVYLVFADPEARSASAERMAAILREDLAKREVWGRSRS